MKWILVCDTRLSYIKDGKVNGRNAVKVLMFQSKLKNIH